MKILIGGLGTLGSNFIFTLLKSNTLRKEWDLSLVDYDVVSDRDVKYTWFSNIGKSKIVECVRLIYKIHNKNVSIIDFFNGKMEEYLDTCKSFFDIILDFRDTNTEIPNLPCNRYFKCFVNNDYGILLNMQDYKKFRYNPKEYDSKPEVCSTFKFCKYLIELLDENKVDIKSFVIDFNNMNKHDLTWRPDYENKLVEV